MNKVLKLFTIFLFGMIVVNATAKNTKEDVILILQSKVNQAYKLGHADAAPLELAAIEKKLIQARALQKKRKKKDVQKLATQIEVDLKIVEKRFVVNQLNLELLKIQEENSKSKKILDELKGQLK